jgi:hypothetical protein
VNPDAWPTPSEGASREPLPRFEDLPIAEQGYDQASVKAAFDSFYRHAAQLDAALRTLEAVDSFQRQAAALRADLRTLRATGWTQQPFPAPPAYGYDMRGPREGISPAVWRILGEVVFLIAVAVFLGVAKLQWWVIVSVMGGAFLIVAMIEWVTSRDRWSAPAPGHGSVHPVLEAQPVAQQPEESEPIGWAAFEQAQEPSDAMTMIGEPEETPAPEEEAPEDVVRTPAADDEPDIHEPEPVVDAAVADEDGGHEASQPESEPVSASETAEEGEVRPRRRWWRRQGRASDDAVSGQPQDAPRHVRVLAPDDADVAPAAVDPWEQGFDPEPADAESIARAEPDEDTGEGTPLAAESEPPAGRRFRRR